MILKPYLLKSIFKGASGCFAGCIMYLFNLTNTFLITWRKLDVYSTYENVVISGDFNAQEGQKCLDTFLYRHKLKFLDKEVRKLFVTETQISQIALISY